jgi:hypothetical protein
MTSSTPVDDLLPRFAKPLHDGRKIRMGAGPCVDLGKNAVVLGRFAGPSEQWAQGIRRGLRHRTDQSRGR